MPSPRSHLWVLSFGKRTVEVKRVATTTCSPSRNGPLGSVGNAKVSEPAATVADELAGCSTPTAAAMLEDGSDSSTQRAQDLMTAASSSCVTFPVVLSPTGKTAANFLPQTRRAT